MDSRARILDRLGRSRDISQQPVEPPGADQAAVRARFTERLLAARCTTETVPHLSQVPDAIRAFLDGLGFVGPVQLAPGLREKLPSEALERGLEDLDLAADGLAVIADCVAGVAETGTLVVTSGGDSDPRLYYLAETLIVLLNAARVVERYEQAWPFARAAGDGRIPRLVSFLTGPSRTADIEQTIEFGAHGARRLHVLLVEEGL